MCFHGRKKSLAAGDSGAGTGAVSAEDEIEPGIIEKHPIKILSELNIGPRQ